MYYTSLRLAGADPWIEVGMHRGNLVPRLESLGTRLAQGLVRPCARAVFLRALKVTEYGSGRGLVEMDQLAVAAYVRLQLQNMTDESRGTTQSSRARSMRDL